MGTITDINQLDLHGTYTYADYLQWNFEEYVELFRGKVMRRSPAPLRQHQDIAGRIFGPLQRYLRRQLCKVYIAPFDVRLPQAKSEIDDQQIYTVVQPDVCIICDPAKPDRRGCTGAPDTMIEILAAGNMDRDLKKQFDLYQEHGVREYRIVGPGLQSVTIYILNAAGKYALAGEYSEPGPVPMQSLPRFELLWEDIFEE